MTTYVRATLEARRPGSDVHACWLTLCHTHGLRLAGIFDPHGLSTHLALGESYEFLLELTYPHPSVPFPTMGVTWDADIVDCAWPHPPVGVARAPLPKAKDRPHGEATGPTCVLLRTPFGHMVTTMSHLRHHLPHPPGVADLITVPPTQRLLLLAVVA